MKQSFFIILILGWMIQIVSCSSSKSTSTVSSDGQPQWQIKNFTNTFYLYKDRELQTAIPTQIFVRNACLWLWGEFPANPQEALSQRITQFESELKQPMKAPIKRQKETKLFELKRLKNLLELAQTEGMFDLSNSSARLADLKEMFGLKKRYSLRRVFEFPSEIHTLSISEIKRTLALGFDSGQILFWPLQDHFNLPPTFPSDNKARSPIIQLSWNQTGELILVERGMDTHIDLQILQYQDGMQFKKLASDQTPLNSHTVWMLNPLQIATFSESGEFITKQLATQTNSLELQHKSFKPITSLSFSPTHRFMASIHPKLGTSLWNVDASGKLSNHPSFLKIPHGRYVQFSPTKPITAITRYIDGEEASVLVWDVQKNDIVHELACNPAPDHSIAFHPTGKFFVCGNNNGTVHLYSTDTFQQTERLLELKAKQIDSFPWKISFTPDGSYLLGVSNRHLYVWAEKAR